MFKHEFLCLWHILDYSHKILLGLCIYIFGVTAVILNVWLGYAFMRSRVLTFRSHILLLNVCIASLIKSLVTGFVFYGSSALAGKWLFGTSTCHLFAFLRQLIGVFQMMILTLIAVERLVVSRPKRRGNAYSDLPLKFYVIGLGICWLIGVVFSLFPLLGYGTYNCDVSGTMCELDWQMLSTKQITFNGVFAVCCGLIPVLITFCCLWVANCSIERSIEYKVFDQKSFTKTVSVMTALLLLLWAPRAILSLWIFCQNLHPPGGIPVALGVVAPICVEAGEIVPVLCYLTYDLRLRTGLLEICERVRQRRQGRKPVRLVSAK